MGTRADFYVGRGEDAEWLGSIAWDGYPEGITPYDKGAAWVDGASLFDATTEAEYRERLERFFLNRDDVSRPEHGWPWPWDTSHTTDFAYALDGEKVYASCYGDPWQVAAEYDGDREDGGAPVAFPDMAKRKNVQLGSKRSGLIVVSAPK